MKPGLELRLNENLKELKLSTMHRDLKSQLRQAEERGSTYEDFLLDLTDVEIQHRTEARQLRRLREAKFPLLKPLETFDLESTPTLDKRLLSELSGCGYIEEQRNIILLGKSGTGKTHLATALGIIACNENYKVKFATGYSLVNELVESRKEKTLSKLMQRYSRYNLLILDELGYLPFTKEGAELLFQVLAERHERGSVIITTNLGFGDWTQIFGDKTMTAALLDRVLHKAHILSFNWESYRLKETLKTKKGEQEKIK